MTEEKEKKPEDIKKKAEALKCPVGKALYYMEEFLSGPMCGRCFPCSMGAYEARERLKKVTDGRGAEADIRALRRIALYMADASLCKKGKDTARFLLDWMDTGVYDEHVKGRCPAVECKGLIKYMIIPGKCVMCGDCKDACKFDAIAGEKKIAGGRAPHLSGYLPFEIRQVRCTKCGECIKVCPAEAIEAGSVTPAENIVATAGTR